HRHRLEFGDVEGRGDMIAVRAGADFGLVRFAGFDGPRGGLQFVGRRFLDGGGGAVVVVRGGSGQFLGAVPGRFASWLLGTGSWHKSIIQIGFKLTAGETVTAGVSSF